MEPSKHSKASAGRLGGLARSAAKTAAVRQNGKRGGRPQVPEPVGCLYQKAGRGNFYASVKRGDKRLTVTTRTTDETAARRVLAALIARLKRSR